MYTLATKTKTGDVIRFGGIFSSRAIAEAKRQAVAALAPQYPVYMVRVDSQ
jgi:hypothetical protein